MGSGEWGVGSGEWHKTDINRHHLPHSESSAPRPNPLPTPHSPLPSFQGWHRLARQPQAHGRPQALCPARPVAPLARLEGVRLFSLQKGPGSDQLPSFAASWPIIDLASRCQDFADTAAAMSNLDLVITVDSAPAHCAGALGMPVWVALAFVADWHG